MLHTTVSVNRRLYEAGSLIVAHIFATDSTERVLRQMDGPCSIVVVGEIRVMSDD